MGTRLCVCLSVCLRSGIVRRRTSNKPDHHCQIALSLFLFPFSLLALIFCWQRYCQQLERTHTSKLSKLSPLTERRRKEEEEKEESLTALLEERESEPKPGTTQSKKCSSKVEIGKEKKKKRRNRVSVDRFGFSDTSNYSNNNSSREHSQSVSKTDKGPLD